MTCPGPSGRDNSFGRRRREAESEAESVKGIQEEDVTGSSKVRLILTKQTFHLILIQPKVGIMFYLFYLQVELREMFRVYESRDSIPANDASGQLITGMDVLSLPMTYVKEILRVVFVRRS